METVKQSGTRVGVYDTVEPLPENRVFYPALDGLRAVAFLVVFFYHYYQLPWGFEGVDVFFVLSGFLITGILFDTRDKPNRARTFYIRRTLRIFPLYYAVMLALLILHPMIHWEWSWSWLSWPLYVGNLWPYCIRAAMPMGQLLSLLNFEIYGVPIRFPPLELGHFWTLCVEEQFYIVWPWVVYNIRSRSKLIHICAWSLPVCVVVRLLALNYLPPWMLAQSVIFHATPFRVDDLLLGGMLALLLRGSYASAILRMARLLTPILFVLLVLLLWTTPQGQLLLRPYPYPAYDTMMLWVLPLVAIFTGLLILMAIQPKTWVAQILAVPPLRWLGKISYGAYVFHVIFINYFLLLGKKWMPTHARFCGTMIALVGTILIAWLSYHFFESHFIRLKNRWS